MQIKKILLVSKFSDDQSVYTYASSFQTTLQKLGYHVEIFNYKKKILPLGRRRRWLTYDHLPGILKFLNNFLCNQKLLRRAVIQKYNLIFFIKAETIFPKTLCKLKFYTNALLINFYPDNPFSFWNENSNANVLNSLPFFDNFFIWSKMLIPAIKSAGAKKVSYFPFAVDEKIFNQKFFLQKDEKQYYKSDVCFVGTWDKEREQYLSYLVQQMPNLRLAIWGNLWQDQLQLQSLLRPFLRGEAIYKTKMRKAFCCSKIVLNFIRQQNMTSHNMRTFEVMASNAFLLTQWTEEQTTYPFREGENIECFESKEELYEKVIFFLRHYDLRKTITQKSFLLSKHFILKRHLKKVLKTLEEGEK
jgi:spore maturation protein CgeB